MWVCCYHVLWLLIWKLCTHIWLHFWVHPLLKYGILIPWILFNLFSITQCKFMVDFACACLLPGAAVLVSPKISAIITDLSACAPANLQVFPHCRPHNLTPTFFFFFILFLGGGVSCPHRACVGSWSYDTPPPVLEKANRPIEQCCLNNKTHKKAQTFHFNAFSLVVNGRLFNISVTA